MKIALLSFEYPPETGFGGIGTYTWYQARALARLGHTVHVLAGDRTTSGVRQTMHEGVRVFRFRADGGLMRVLRLLDRPRLHWTRNRLENALSMFRLLRELRRTHGYDLIEMPECGGEGLLVNHLLPGPRVVRLHSPARMIMPFYDTPRADRTLCALAEGIGMRGADAFSACSAFLAGAARERLGIRTPIRVIANGIDLAGFDGEQPDIDIRRQLDIPAHRPIVFFSGRMEPRKGIHVAKDVTAEILARHDVAFVFAGQDLFRYMEDTLLPHLSARRLRGSVHYLGRLELPAVRACVRQSDIVLLPSLWENCPYACLEAMAAGRAIVASDQGGVPELIRHGESGLLAASGNAAAFTHAIEQLLEDPAARERLGGNARRTVAMHFTDAAIARQSLDWYRDCLEHAA